MVNKNNTQKNICNYFHINSLFLRLTSWVLIALRDAAQAEWEEYNLFIDPFVRAKASQWIISHQRVEGSWQEHSNILDREKFQVIIY